MSFWAQSRRRYAFVELLVYYGGAFSTALMIDGGPDLSDGRR